jgi:hypothetical protein
MQQCENKSILHIFNFSRQCSSCNMPALILADMVTSAPPSPQPVPRTPDESSRTLQFIERGKKVFRSGFCDDEEAVVSVSVLQFEKVVVPSHPNPLFPYSI